MLRTQKHSCLYVDKILEIENAARKAHFYATHSIEYIKTQNNQEEKLRSQEKAHTDN